MTYEINIYGVFMPTLIVIALGALFVMRIVRTFLEHRGFYRYVWHPPLFNLSLYFVFLALGVMIVHRTLI